MGGCGAVTFPPPRASFLLTTCSGGRPALRTGPGLVNLGIAIVSFSSVLVAGGSSVYRPPVYGTKGVRAAANEPGGRSGHTVHYDAPSNQLWILFGGGYILGGSGATGILNDAWAMRIDNFQLLYTWCARFLHCCLVSHVHLDQGFRKHEGRCCCCVLVWTTRRGKHHKSASGPLVSQFMPGPRQSHHLVRIASFQPLSVSCCLQGVWRKNAGQFRRS